MIFKNENRIKLSYLYPNKITLIISDKKGMYYNEELNEVDYFNDSLTQNGRVSYPINHIKNYVPSLSGNHPNNIVFLICDALGVMPIISKLTLDQAIDYFLLGCLIPKTHHQAECIYRFLPILPQSDSWGLSG